MNKVHNIALQIELKMKEQIAEIRITVYAELEVALQIVELEKRGYC
jgi:hypothetical protein